MTPKHIFLEHLLSLFDAAFFFIYCTNLSHTPPSIGLPEQLNIHSIHFPDSSFWIRSTLKTSLNRSSFAPTKFFHYLNEYDGHTTPIYKIFKIDYKSINRMIVCQLQMNSRNWYAGKQRYPSFLLFTTNCQHKWPAIIYNNVLKWPRTWFKSMFRQLAQNWIAWSRSH